MRVIIAVLMILSIFVLPAFTNDKDVAIDDQAPACLKGFAGMLEGKLIKKLDAGFILEVTGVKKVWKHNKSEDYENAIGKKIKVYFRKIKTDKETYKIAENLAAYIKKVEIGAKIEIDAREDDNKIFFLELSKEQRALAEKKEEKKDTPKNKKDENECKNEFEIPEGMTGFSGVLEGVVVKKLDRGFVLKVTGVPRVWKESKAKNTAAVISKKVAIYVGWIKNDKSKWHPNDKHTKFIKSLKLEQKLKIEAKNFEGKHLNILELGE